MNDNHDRKINAIYPILIIILCAAFLFYKYVLQIYPSIITNQLMKEFNLDGATLGHLAATFYYTYMITQLFVGVLLDKYSNRWLTGLAILSCGVGAYLFAQSETLMNASLSRALMGVGVAFATVAYLKAAATWFNPKHYAFLSGLLATAAMMGAVFGETPVALMIGALGWRDCLQYIGIAGLLLGITFIIVVRDRELVYIKDSHKVLNADQILAVIKNKQNWILTFYSGLAFSPVAIFGGLWGNPFLQQAYAITSTQAASLLSLIFIGLAVGAPVLGMLSDYLENRKSVMFWGTIISLIALLAVLYCHSMPIILLAFLLFLFGFALGVFMLVFVLGKESNSPRMTATVIAMINACEPLLDSITEPGIGKLLDLGWDGKMVDGVRFFSLTNYHFALSLLPLYLIIAVLLVLKMKESQNWEGQQDSIAPCTSFS